MPRTLSAAMLSLVIASPILAQDGWQPMDFQSFQEPATDVLQTLVWPDVIRDANAYVTGTLKRSLQGRNALVTALSSTFQDGSRTIIVSVALSRQCDSGANDKGAEVEPSTCPVRIATVENGKLVRLKTATGCYVHPDDDAPMKNRGDQTYSRFDMGSGTIALRTVVGGRDAPRCAQRITVR